MNLSTPAPVLPVPITGVPAMEAVHGRSADDAVVALFDVHYHPLVRAAVLLVRDQETAEDVVQDAFVDLCRRWGRLREPEKAAAYLRTAVVNRARSVLRHRAVVARTDAVGPDRGLGPAATVAGADHAVVQNADRAHVLDALATLPRRQREVLVLRHYLGLSETEIAETLGISRGSVKTHAARGAAALRAIVSPEPGGDEEQR